MLKIKDNINLKELEKFGFVYQEYHMFPDNPEYRIEFGLMESVVKIDVFNRYITIYDWTEDSEITDQMITKLFDLIKADLVEKVEE